MIGNLNTSKRKGIDEILLSNAGVAKLGTLKLDGNLIRVAVQYGKF